jgi:polar amino acid transport system substrate-binding protein
MRNLNSFYWQWPPPQNRAETSGEGAMRTIQWLMTAGFSLILSGCAGVQTAPTPETRNALAPTGKLRVGFLSTTPLHGTRDAASGEFKGVAVDLGKELARRIGVPFEAVAYSSLPALMTGAKTGEWDVAAMGINAARALVVDFSAPYMGVEFSYLVPGGSSISSLTDVDRPGVRIAVLEKSSPDAYLSVRLRNATLVRTPTIAGMVGSLGAGKADAVFATKANLLSQAEKIAGSRVLEGRSGGEETGMAVPKGRALSAAYVRTFVEDAKAEGLVKAAIERAGLRGVVVAPLK